MKTRKKQSVLCLTILILLSSTNAWRTSAVEAVSAEMVIQAYLTMPIPAEDRRGEARLARLEKLRSLQAMTAAAVPAIRQALAQVTNHTQRAELAESLRNHPSKESAAVLIGLLDDPEASVRRTAIHQLRLMARRVDRIGGHRQQRGGEFTPQVPGLVPDLIRAANDGDDLNRVTALFALADTLDPQAIAELRRHLGDTNEDVRLAAACLLTEFQDASGLDEMKKALERLRFASEPKVTDSFATERLLASFERLTGKSFGPVPPNPFLDSDSRQAEGSRQRYRELLDTWAAWWAWKPAVSK